MFTNFFVTRSCGGGLNARCIKLFPKRKRQKSVELFIATNTVTQANCGCLVLLVFRYALQYEAVKVYAFHKIAHKVSCHVETYKMYVVCHCRYRCWHVHFFADVAQLFHKKVVVCQKLTLVHNVACNFIVAYCFCPNFHNFLQRCFVHYTKKQTILQRF